MRARMHTLIQRAQPGDRLSKFYDLFIVAMAFLSVTPLMVKGSHPLLETVDVVTVYILFADYIFRWITCDYAGGKSGVRPFIKYPFAPFSIIVLLSLLPSMGLLGPGFRILRMLRVFVIFHYSENFRYIADVFRKERKTLMSVLLIALFYIFVSALAMFAYEPDTFNNFFDALYWATTALTTVGYGDVYPTSAVGRLISMVSSLFGIAVIALPAGIVTAGFVEEINKNTAEKERRRQEEQVAGTAPAQHRPLFNLTPTVRRYALLMALAVAMNLLLGLLARHLALPVWLDSVGTVFAALALEPAAGLVVGLANNMIEAIFTYGTGSLLYYAVSAAVAVIAGVFVKRQGRITGKRMALGILLGIIVTTALSATADIWITHGTAPATYWENHFYTLACSVGMPHIPAFYFGELVVRGLDTLATALLAGGFYTLLLRIPRYRAGR